MTKDYKNRPPWYHPLARAKFDGSMTPYREVQAKLLSPEEREQFDVDLPISWQKQPVSWLLTSLGYGEKGLPKGSGAGFVQVPWMDIYTKTYGNTPIADLPKYRTIFRNSPDVQEAVELQVSLAVGRGFSIIHPIPEVEDYLKKIVDDIHLRETMLVLASDCLVYGNAYGEILWDEEITKTEQLFQVGGSLYTPSEVNAAVKRGDFSASAIKMAVSTAPNGQPQRFEAQVISKDNEAKEIYGIKCLDPVYMRVRRDAWDNIFGYIQWLAAPPALIENECMMHIKYRPKSWSYESAYGTSILMSLIKNDTLLTQFENDASIWMHLRVIIPLIVQGGTPEKPYSTLQMQDLMSKLAGRSAASMMFTKGDVNIKEIEGAARALNVQWWLDYLLTRRYQALGVPPVLLGMPAGSVGGNTGEVLLQEFITRIQLLQEFLSHPIETQIFYPLIVAKFGKVWKNKEGKEVSMPNANIIWPPVVEEDRNMRSARLIQGLQGGAISVNEYRTEMGFEKLREPKFDEVKGPTEGITQPKAWQQNKLPEETKKEEELSPEVSFRIKKMRLLVSQEQFKTELQNLVRIARFDLEQSDKLTKDVKKDLLNRSKKIIENYITNSYLYGKMDAKEKDLTEDDLVLKKEELSEVADLKKKYAKDFEKIIDDMIKAKQEGILFQ